MEGGEREEEEGGGGGGSEREMEGEGKRGWAREGGVEGGREEGGLARCSNVLCFQCGTTMRRL